MKGTVFSILEELISNQFGESGHSIQCSRIDVDQREVDVQLLHLRLAEHVCQYASAEARAARADDDDLDFSLAFRHVCAPTMSRSIGWTRITPMPSRMPARRIVRAGVA